MKTWERFLTEKHNQSYDYSSTQINLPASIAKSVINFGKTIPDDEVFNDPDGGKGREDDIHVTVLYGIHSKKPDQVKSILKKFKPFNVSLGKISVFDTNDDFDVVKIEVISPELVKLNKELSNQCENSNSFPTYNPHVTIAYVKKGNGKKYLGEKDFASKSFEAKEVIFSSSNGTKTTLPFAN